LKLNLNPTVHFDDHPPYTLSFVDIYFVGGNYCQLWRKSGKAMKEKEWKNSHHHLPKTLTTYSQVLRATQSKKITISVSDLNTRYLLLTYLWYLAIYIGSYHWWAFLKNYNLQCQVQYLQIFKIKEPRFQLLLFYFQNKTTVGLGFWNL
jgi:hypothetical protein